MASIKNLKKDINGVFDDIIVECCLWELANPKADMKNSEAIIGEAVQAIDDLIAKVNAKDVENKKAHFKSISTELESRASELLEKVNKL